MTGAIANQSTGGCAMCVTGGAAAITCQPRQLPLPGRYSIPRVLCSCCSARRA
jgi:hypothetical protein